MWGGRTCKTKDLFFAKIRSRIGLCGCMQNHVEPHMTQKKIKAKKCIGQSSLLGGCIENLLLKLGGVLWCEVRVGEHDNYSSLTVG